MRSASERLPLRSTLFTSAVTNGEPYTGSVTSCRLVAGPLRGMSALLLLRAVTAAGLLAVADALGVQGATDDLVAHARQVPHPAAAYQHDRVLLEVVADTGDVGRDLDLAGEPDPGHLAKGRVRLLGRGGVDARAHPAALRAGLERRGLVLGYLVLPALADQLLDRWQRVSIFSARLAARYSYIPGLRVSSPARRLCGPVAEPGRREREVLRMTGPRGRRPSGCRDHRPRSCCARELRARRARLPTLDARVKANRYPSP